MSAVRKLVQPSPLTPNKFSPTPSETKAAISSTHPRTVARRVLTRPPMYTAKPARAAETTKNGTLAHLSATEFASITPPSGKDEPATVAGWLPHNTGSVASYEALGDWQYPTRQG